MKLYTIVELNQGVGVFNHVMHGAAEHPGRYTGMGRSVGIGFLSAAIQSGLSPDAISDVIASYFDPNDAEMLRVLRRMYDGDDRRLHLWRESSEQGPRVFGKYLPYVRPVWRAKRDQGRLPDESDVCF